MSSLPATPPLSGVRYDESVHGPKVKEGETCSASRDSEYILQLQHAISLDIAGVEDKTKSFESIDIAKITPPEFDKSPEYSIQLPIELWEKVIDYLADEWRDDYKYDGARMRELGRVCRGWHARCRFRGRKMLDVKHIDKEEVYRLINTLDQDPERCRVIEAVSFKLRYTLISIFGSFTVCMAQKLPRVEWLRLMKVFWVTERLHAQVFVHVTLAFGSVRILELNITKFPSALVFGRLLRALPRLSSLKCHSVYFEKRCNVTGRVWPWVRYPLRLDVVEVSDSNDVVDFLALSGARLCHLVCCDPNLEKLSELVTVSAQSLSSLKIAPQYANFTPDKGTSAKLSVRTLKW
ncbi:uncharacterized protein FIBRA_03096 [Fibroporia radiculosa]|uniref:F-box domain-containing protein n=1 Tax=Fibroporia radiculosa TaxID=599839 RepID=J4G454_9APHY|nr:uncharacterized protein FIBRA_03096 [Fibroporia radiculosa]CCM01048.1 predicted protein [Fibroporia radiculosa]